jgi:GNAT superfamily N-acetyltransferase
VSDAPTIRDAVLPRDLDEVKRLWLDYLAWGNAELQSRHGFRLPVEEAVEHDVATIEKYQPPDGRIVLAVRGDRACGIGCLKRIGPATAELKRMYVEPAERGSGVGRRILERLLEAAEAAGYERVRLDSVRFMTAAHAMYRRAGFVEIEQYPESEIPPEYRPHWLFMERPTSHGAGR